MSLPPTSLFQPPPVTVHPAHVTQENRDRIEERMRRNGWVIMGPHLSTPDWFDLMRSREGFPWGVVLHPPNPPPVDEAAPDLSPAEFPLNVNPDSTPVTQTPFWEIKSSSTFPSPRPVPSPFSTSRWRRFLSGTWLTTSHIRAWPIIDSPRHTYEWPPPPPPTRPTVVPPLFAAGAAAAALSHARPALPPPAPTPVAQADAEAEASTAPASESRPEDSGSISSDINLVSSSSSESAASAAATSSLNARPSAVDASRSTLYISTAAVTSPETAPSQSSGRSLQASASEPSSARTRSRQASRSRAAASAEEVNSQPRYRPLTTTSGRLPSSVLPPRHANSQSSPRTPVTPTPLDTELIEESPDGPRAPLPWQSSIGPGPASILVSPRTPRFSIPESPITTPNPGRAFAHFTASLDRLLESVRLLRSSIIPLGGWERAERHLAELHGHLSRVRRAARSADPNYADVSQALRLASTSLAAALRALHECRLDVYPERLEFPGSPRWHSPATIAYASADSLAQLATSAERLGRGWTTTHTASAFDNPSATLLHLGQSAPKQLDRLAKRFDWVRDVGTMEAKGEQRNELDETSHCRLLAIFLFALACLPFLLDSTSTLPAAALSLWLVSGSLSALSILFCTLRARFLVRSTAPQRGIRSVRTPLNWLSRVVVAVSAVLFLSGLLDVAWTGGTLNASYVALSFILSPILLCAAFAARIALGGSGIAPPRSTLGDAESNSPAVHSSKRPGDEIPMSPRPASPSPQRNAVDIGLASSGRRPRGNGDVDRSVSISAANEVFPPPVTPSQTQSVHDPPTSASLPEVTTSGLPRPETPFPAVDRQAADAEYERLLKLKVDYERLLHSKPWLLSAEDDLRRKISELVVKMEGAAPPSPDAPSQIETWRDCQILAPSASEQTLRASSSPTGVKGAPESPAPIHVLKAATHALRRRGHIPQRSAVGPRAPDTSWEYVVPPSPAAGSVQALEETRSRRTLSTSTAQSEYGLRAEHEKRESASSVEQFVDAQSDLPSPVYSGRSLPLSDEGSEDEVPSPPKRDKGKGRAEPRGGNW